MAAELRMLPLVTSRAISLYCLFFPYRSAESNLVVLKLEILVVCWIIYSLQGYTDPEGKLFYPVIWGSI
jgi:hypothetical protein